MPIPVTHVGSLVRPDELISFMRAIDAGEPYDEAAYQRCLRDSVRDVVRRQKEVGVDIVSDGEYGKSSWNYYVYRRLAGLELRPAPPVRMQAVTEESREEDPTIATDWARFPEFYAAYFAKEQGEFEEPGGIWACTSEIRYTGQEAIARDIANLRAAMDAEGVSEGFLPVVAPASCFPTLIDEHYGSEQAALMGVAEALREEYRAIVDAGLSCRSTTRSSRSCTTCSCRPGRWTTTWPGRARASTPSTTRWRGMPPERVRYHVCWGSWNGPHTNDIPLRDVLQLVFSVNAGTYLFEAANPRHEHEWRVWQDVELPAGKKLAPGVISHATNVVEHPELVAERLERIGRLVGAENLLASTDCGFAQGPYLQRVHPTIQWAKLRALSEGAALASRALEGAPA